MHDKPWVPTPLRKYKTARLALGVFLLKGDPVPPDPMTYSHRFEGKVMNLLLGREAVEEELNPIVARNLDEKASPLEMLDTVMENDDRVMSPMMEMKSYLRKESPLRELREFLDLNLAEPEPVTEKEFRKELDELTLQEYLELM